MLTALIIVVIVACVGLVVAYTLRNRSGMGQRKLRDRFGPEYDRVLERHEGDDAATRKELTDRLSRHRDMATHRLSEQEREQYTAKWSAVQERFVEEPSRAVADADQLLADLLRDCGYPADDLDERTDALSVHHPRHVQHYRDSHALATRTDQSVRDGSGTEDVTGTEPVDGHAQQSADTEQLRTSLLHSRELFDELLPSTQPDRGSADGDSTAPARPGSTATSSHRHAA